MFPPFLSRTTPTCPPVQRKTVAVTPLAAVRSPASKRRVGSHFSRATTTSSVRWDLHPGADPCPGSTELTLGHRHLLLWPSLCLLKCECYGLSHQKESEEDTLESESYLTHSIELLGWKKGSISTRYTEVPSSCLPMPQRRLQEFGFCSF